MLWLIHCCVLKHVDTGLCQNKGGRNVMVIIIVRAISTIGKEKGRVISTIGNCSGPIRREDWRHTPRAGSLR
jgi:hypothetical protein